MSLCPSLVSCSNISGYNPALSPSAANPCWLCVSCKLDKQTCWGSSQATKSEGAQDKVKDKGPILANDDSLPGSARPPDPSVFHSRPISVPTTDFPTAGSQLLCPTLLVEGHFLLPCLPHPKQAQPCHMTFPTQS